MDAFRKATNIEPRPNLRHSLDWLLLLYCTRERSPRSQGHVTHASRHAREVPHFPLRRFRDEKRKARLESAVRCASFGLSRIAE